jgi:hypothetical protein
MKPTPAKPVSTNTGDADRPWVQFMRGRALRDC